MKDRGKSTLSSMILLLTDLLLVISMEISIMLSTLFVAIPVVWGAMLLLRVQLAMSGCAPEPQEQARQNPAGKILGVINHSLLLFMDAFVLVRFFGECNDIIPKMKLLWNLLAAALVGLRIYLAYFMAKKEE